MKTFQVTAHPKKEHSGKAALSSTPFILANIIHVWMLFIASLVAEAERLKVLLIDRRAQG